MVIVGAGILGIYQLYRAVEAGYSARLLEQGGGVGGTWYWNRYPGCRFDSESYTYGYLFSEELWQEWDWSEEFAGAAGDRALPQLRGGQVRPAPSHPVNSRVTSAGWDEASASWTTADGGRVRDPVPVPDHRDRRAVSAAVPRRARPGGLPGRGLPHRCAGRRSRWTSGQARRRHRHRLDRRPDRPGDRGRGRVADHVPAHAELGHPAEQPADLGRGSRPISRPASRRSGRTAKSRSRVPAQADWDEVPSTTPLRSGRRSTRRSGTARGFAKISTQLRGHGAQPRGQRRVVRIHRGQDPRHRRGPGDRGQADPGRPRLRRPAAPVRHRLLRDVQQAQRRAGRPARDADRQGHRDRHRDRPTGCASSTSSSGRPASTSAPAPCCGWASRGRRAAAQGVLGRRAAHLPRHDDATVSRTSSSPAARTARRATTRATAATRSTSRRT